MAEVADLVDAHHHLWDLARCDLPFLNVPVNEPIRRTFGPQEMGDVMRRHGVEQTVVVQAAPDPTETWELLDVAAGSPLIGGVVGWIDLDAPDPQAELDALLDHPARDRLVGIRAMAQDHPDPDWLASEGPARAAAAIGAAGRVCELLITPREMTAAQSLVERAPNTRFVIDHAAKPPIATGRLEGWAEGIRRLAGLPHTACKVSGLISEADWRRWTVDDVAPFMDTVAGAFGEDRLLFGSDWPVCLLAGSYCEVLTVARETLAGLPAEKVFAGNARRIYALAHPPGA
ncbi:MAG TPA: amidohydrolase family protein [Solirubrobacteraceae bacterium]|nr:amidohydrolase family protein [Solirubrobacteraceae bacterium]